MLLIVLWRKKLSAFWGNCEKHTKSVIDLMQENDIVPDLATYLIMVHEHCTHGDLASAFGILEKTINLEKNFKQIIQNFKIKFHFKYFLFEKCFQDSLYNILFENIKKTSFLFFIFFVF